MSKKNRRRASGVRRRKNEESGSGQTALSGKSAPQEVIPGEQASEVCRPGCCGFDRRQFLKGASASLLASAFPTIPAMAGPFGAFTPGVEHFVPAEKNLARGWVRSLYEKGERRIYRGKELDTIGMPIGGIAAGQMYLCGDGTLGNWEIFNRHDFIGYGDRAYAYREPTHPVNHGLAVVIEQGGETDVRRLDRSGFEDVSFIGEYPIGWVRYTDAGGPISVELEAFSPFIPLNAADSALPAVLFHLTVKNTSTAPLKVSLASWLENAVLHDSAGRVDAQRRTRVVEEKGRTLVLHSALPLPEGERPAARDARLFEDFEGEDYGEWLVEGEAFGTGPSRGAVGWQSPVTGFEGEGLVNTFNGTDEQHGTLTSPVFTIDRRFINLLVGGGNHPDRTEARLVVDGEVVRTARGKNNEKLTWLTWTVRELEGKEARIEIIDRESGGWGHINVDHIEFADVPREGGLGKLEELPDYGAMALTLNGPSDSEIARSAAERLMLDAIAMGETMADVPDAPAGIAATPRTKLAPGDTVTAAFAVTWHFPNREHGHFYATRFDNARDVAHYLFDNHERLTADTCLWHDTYYDSSLPYYLLDRLFVPLSTLSTGVCQWWANGRFYAFEGVVCCEGTCTHVWNYAHGHARLFPELARSIREMQDFNSDGGGFHPDTGLVGFRSNDAYAADGQCGTILKACREHQMSPDSAFLERNWPHIRKALEYSMSRDANDDGLIEDSQHNTFDINFEGSNTFVGSLYLAALRAGEAMAREMGDTAFADRCRRVFESGQRKSIERLWDGEYFIQEVDIEQHPKHQYGRGCLSDQVFGQGWAHQLNLGYIYPKENVDSALQAIWKYNWAPDVTRQQEAHGPGRPFVMPGEAGMFTCTWPKSPYLDEGVLYRNEVWTGIEYQVAGHMIWEGMIEEALATVRAVHDRYHPLLRNPWNEVECGDHYARALASWGVYSALSGFRYHGPMKMLAFAPKLGGEIFRTAFVTAEGWGTYELNESDGAPSTVLTLKKGRLPLSTLLLGSGRTKLPRIVIETSPGGQVHEFNASLDEDGAIAIAFPPDFVLNEGEVLRVSESNP